MYNHDLTEEKKLSITCEIRKEIFQTIKLINKESGTIIRLYLKIEWGGKIRRMSRFIFIIVVYTTF